MPTSQPDGSQETLQTCMRRLIDNYLVGEARQISKIADACVLPRSELSRWVNGRSAPALRSGYLERFADHLGASQEDREALRAAHVRFLKYAPPPPPKRLPKKIQGSGGAAPPEVSGDLEGQIPKLPKHGGPLYGRDAISQAAIVLLRSAVVSPVPRDEHGDDTILLTSQARDDLFSSFRYQSAWRQSLWAALQHGWRVEHLIRLDRDPGRLLRIANEIRLFLGFIDTYTPYAVPQALGVLEPPYELLIVPKVGALLFFAADNPHEVDAAFYVPGAGFSEATARHFAQLQGRPDRVRRLLTRYRREDGRIAFLNAMAEAEERQGDRIMLKNGLSAVTRPLSFCSEHSPLVRAYASHGESPGAISARHQRRIRAFEKRVRRYQYRDIATQRSILSLCRDGKYLGDDLQVPEEYVATPSDRLEHLRRVCDLLRTHPRYELAILDEREAKDFFGPLAPHSQMHKRPLSIIKADQVLFETWCRAPSAPSGSISATTGVDEQDLIEIDVVLQEPLVAAAYHAHVMELWNRKIAEPHREKASVLAWLEARIADLIEANPELR